MLIMISVWLFVGRGSDAGGGGLGAYTVCRDCGRAWMSVCAGVLRVRGGVMWALWCFG